MPYYVVGDYYARGDYYTGDPGLFGFIGRAARGFITGGPLGLAAAVVKPVIQRRVQQAVGAAAPPGTAVVPFEPVRAQLPAEPRLAAAGRWREQEKTGRETAIPTCHIGSRPPRYIGPALATKSG